MVDGIFYYTRLTEHFSTARDGHLFLVEAHWVVEVGLFATL